MALITVNGTAGGLGTPYNLGTLDSLIVGPSALVYSSDNAAIIGTGSNQSVFVSGTVVSATQDGISLGTDGTQTGVRVIVAASGYIQAGDDCISINARGASVENFGTLNGAYGVFIGGNDATLSRVLNVGTINATHDGVLAYYPYNTVSLVNQGLIIGGDHSFQGGNGIDSVDNSGEMRGSVRLLDGNDTYLGAYGRVIGLIDGGAGNDTFRVGAGTEDIDGGTGSDLLDFRRTDGIRVALDLAFANSGVAAGDDYISIENIYGSNTGADLLRGNALNNGFYGYGGNDTLQGGAGVDQLAGGAGADAMNGGAGNDTFLYLGLGEAGDVIVDFNNVIGNNDRFVIRAAGFGAGLVAGPLNANLFFSGPTNIAAGAEDRFVFNTTTTTLWFDSNGSAAGGLTMIADLQAGATMSAVDIVLI